MKAIIKVNRGVSPKRTGRFRLIKIVVPFYMGGKDGWMLQHLAEFTFQAPAKQSMSYADQQKAMQGNDLAKLGWDASPNGALATLAGDLMDLQKQGLINSNIVTATYDNQTHG